MWGIQNWGQMIWGDRVAVPALSWLQLLALLLLMMIAGRFLLRSKGAVRSAALGAMFLAFLAGSVAVAVPNTFANGQVANADQVNANFTSLETRIASLELKASNCAAGDFMCQPGLCTHLQTDRNNCGQCGLVCQTGYECFDAVCTPLCASGDFMCQPGLCTHLQTDPQNCGSCARACAPGHNCLSGACQ